MNNKPVFYIIMGPSGAGKSYYGADYVPENIEIFDGDKIAMEIHEKKGFHLPGAYDVMNELLEKKINTALNQMKNFAVESPIGAPLTTRKFKDRGFEIKCIFFGLNNLAESISRIQQRIEGRGNLVTPGDAKRNFENAMKNVVKMKNLYDEVLFISGSDKEKTSQIEAIYSKREFLLYNDKCQWARDLSIHFSGNT